MKARRSSANTVKNKEDSVKPGVLSHLFGVFKKGGGQCCLTLDGDGDTQKKTKREEVIGTTEAVRAIVNVQSRFLVHYCVAFAPPRKGELCMHIHMRTVKEEGRERRHLHGSLVSVFMKQKGASRPQQSYTHKRASRNL